MNCLIGDTFTSQNGDAKIKVTTNLSNGYIKPEFYMDGVNKHTIRNTSLPWEILESAYFFFQHKGYEKTKIQDICNRLNINSAQFYKHFESLDEVLEILWAR